LQGFLAPAEKAESVKAERAWVEVMDPSLNPKAEIRNPNQQRLYWPLLAWINLIDLDLASF